MTTPANEVTVEEYRRLVDELSNRAGGRTHKYNVRSSKEERTLDGYTFDSLAEMRRYCELRLLEREGQIEHLRVHPRFLLLAGFELNGKKYRPIHYEADFIYRDLASGKSPKKLVVEDVKGHRTPKFQLLEKMFLYKYVAKVQAFDGLEHMINEYELRILEA